MSDAIREAFEKWWLIEMGHSIHDQRSGDGYFPSDADASWEAWKAALQSQTAPAVPEGLVDAVKALDVFEPKFGVDFQDEAGTYYCEYCSFHVEYPPKGFEISHDDDCPVTTLRKLLSAAPQHNHSPDAGKVVQVSPAGWIWDAYGSRHFTYGCHHKEVLEADGLTLTPVYTHPAESREEIQADAERYRWLKAQYHREYCPLTIAQRVADSLFEWAAEDPSAAIDAARLRGDKGVE